MVSVLTSFWNLKLLKQTCRTTDYTVTDSIGRPAAFLSAALIQSLMYLYVLCFGLGGIPVAPDTVICRFRAIGPDFPFLRRLFSAITKIALYVGNVVEYGLTYDPIENQSSSKLDNTAIGTSAYIERKRLRHDRRPTLIFKLPPPHHHEASNF